MVDAITKWDKLGQTKKFWLCLLLASFSTMNQSENIRSRYNTVAHSTLFGTVGVSFNNNSTKNETTNIQLDIQKEHWTPEEIFELPPVLWRQWLTRHKHAQISKLRQATLRTKGCGFSMHIDFVTALTNNTNSSMPSHSAFFKAAVSNLASPEAELHLREIKAYYLDRILGTNVALPCVGNTIQHQGVATRNQKNRIYRNLRCMESSSPNATTNKHSFAGAAMIWLEGVKEIPLAEALAAPRRYQHDVFEKKAAVNIHSDAHFAIPLYEESAISYAAFQYLGGCMKSDHNHFTVNGTRFVAIDNDRCMTPEAISSAPSVPKEDARRISQWAKIVLKDICYFPQKLVDNIERAYEARHDDSPSSDRISNRFKQALAEDVLASELLESQPETFLEIDERVNKLAQHIRTCRDSKSNELETGE